MKLDLEMEKETDTRGKEKAVTENMSVELSECNRAVIIAYDAHN